MMAQKQNKTKNLEIISVIIAGGEGIRLWPLSTPENPKPFIKLIGNKSFLRMAYERALTISPRERIFISTLKSLSQHVNKDLPNFPRKNLILEPMPRNTAPAIALAAMALRKFGENAIMTVLPADHYIDSPDIFRKAIFTAAKKAMEKDCLLTFGIKPESPSTEYGYIEAEKMKSSKSIFKVKKFTEKPNLKKAKAFLKKGNYFWNSGIFIWRFDSILQALKKHAPNIFKEISKATHGSSLKHSSSLLKRAFSRIKPISIDYAVMEKAQKVYMTEMKLGWNDFGSWDSLYNFLKKDSAGNVIRGNILNVESKNCLLWSDDGHSLIFGAKNLMIIRSEDKLLVIDRYNIKNLEKIRNLVSELLSRK